MSAYDKHILRLKEKIGELLSEPGMESFAWVSSAVEEVERIMESDDFLNNLRKSLRSNKE